VDTILGAGLHVITTLRTKTAYELVDENGRKKPIKIGLAPVQRDGMEYEFTLVMDLAIDGHVATAAKDRTRLFDAQHFVPTQATGEVLREWLELGKDPAAESKHLLRRLKAAATRIDGVPLLNDWWRKHAAEIPQLTQPDADKLKRHCASRKSAILASKK